MADLIKKNNDNEIEITDSVYDKREVISDEGIEISGEGKAIRGETTGGGVVYLLIDGSGSMSGDNLVQAKKGTIGFAEEAWRKNYSVGLIQFASTATFICEPERESSVLSEQLEKIKAEGDTNMTDAILLVIEKLRNNGGNKVIVIITDGKPNNSVTALAAADQAKENGIDIITIGTDDADTEFLRKIATRTDLAVMVPRKNLEKGITASAKMLPMLPMGK